MWLLSVTLVVFGVCDVVVCGIVVDGKIVDNDDGIGLKLDTVIGAVVWFVLELGIAVDVDA